MVAIQKYGANSNVVHYLQTADQSLRVPSPHEKLVKSNLWIWFTPKGKLWPNYLQATEQETVIKHLKHLPILKEYPTLWNELVTMLQKMINVGQPLSTSVVQPILRGIIESLTPKIFYNGHGGFIISREWTKQFLKHYMNWSFRMATIAVNKMPTDWHEQGCNMVYRIVYLMKLYSIPPCLVVSTNQTRIHLVPTVGEKA